jgi:DNA-binding MarR family transcriptional regulator
MGTATEIADDLRLVIGRLARRLRQQTLDGMTPSQRSVIATLESNGPLRMGELARIENVSPPSITGIVGRLEERGLVSRVSDPEDARSTRVEITIAARQLLGESRKRRSMFLAQRLERLDQDERALLARAVPVLDRLIEE